MAVKKENVRNFCIVAHIDHGKSTLADRLMEKTGQVSERDMEEQLLDSMDLEKERGITILVSTPYMDEASRCDRIALCNEGRILKIDTPEGIVRGFDKQLYGISAKNMFALLDKPGYEEESKAIKARL